MFFVFLIFPPSASGHIVQYRATVAILTSLVSETRGGWWTCQSYPPQLSGVVLFRHLTSRGRELDCNETVWDLWENRTLGLLDTSDLPGEN